MSLLLEAQTVERLGKALAAIGIECSPGPGARVEGFINVCLSVPAAHTLSDLCERARGATETVVPAAIGFAALLRAAADYLEESSNNPKQEKAHGEKE